MGEMRFYRKEKKYTEDNIQDYLREWITTGNVGKFYGTALWKAKRDEIMRRDGCMCQLCRMQGVQTPAEVVHHIEHLDRVENIPLALDNNNLLSLCKFCHKVVHKGLLSVLSYWDNPPAWAQDLQQIMFFYLRQQQQQSYFNPSYYFPDTLTLSQPIQSQQQTANQQQQQQQINNIYQRQEQRGQYYPYYPYPYPYQPQGQQGQGQQQQQQPYIYPYQSQQPPQYNPYPYIPGA